MYEVLVSLLTEHSIKVARDDLFELFEVAEIDLEPHRRIAKHILQFCSVRSGVPEANFVMRVLKAADTLSGTARFGLALQVPADDLTGDALAKLAAEVAQLVPHLVSTHTDQPLPGFDSPELKQPAGAEARCQDLSAAITTSVTQLRTEAGGTRLPMPIAICTGTQVLAVARQALPPKPDTPVRSRSSQVQGLLKSVEFGALRTCRIVETHSARGAEPPRTVKAIIPTDSLLDTVITLGKTRELCLFTLKVHDRVGQESCTELLSAFGLDRDLAPLDSER